MAAPANEKWNLALRELVAEAAKGTQFPQIKVLAGNTLYVGYLGTAEQHRERFEHGLTEQLFNDESPKKRAAAEEVYPRAVRQAEALTAAASGGSEQETFGLLNCQIWPASGGDGVEVAIVQVPYAAVDGWWMGAQKKLSKGSGGSGLFAGLMFPLPVSN